MVNYCCVRGCGSNEKRVPGSRYFRFPLWKRSYGPQMEDVSRRRRLAWVSAVRLKEVTFESIPKHFRVCSMHFHSGKPCYEMLETDPDWAPSLRLGHSEDEASDPPHEEERALCELELQQRREAARAAAREAAREVAREAAREAPLKAARKAARDAARSETKEPLGQRGVKTKEKPKETNKENPKEGSKEQKQLLLLVPTNANAPPLLLQLPKGATPTSPPTGPPQQQNHQDCSLCDLRRDEINRLMEENRLLKQQLATAKFSEGFFLDADDDKVRYYTGLPDHTTFSELLTGLQPLLPSNTPALSPFQMLLLTLVRLRLDLPVPHLANLFSVSSTTVYRYFRETVLSLHTVMSHAIVWPERDALAKTMTQPFVDAFGDTAVIVVDVFEIVTEKPSTAEAQSQMLSPRKHAPAVKYLVAVTPRGATCFLSRGFGGSVSDKRLLQESGLLSRLRPGDVVLAYKGFDLTPGTGLLCAELRHWDGGGPLLVARDAKKLKKVYHLRGGVKKAVGSWVQRYKILSGVPVPVSLTAPLQGEELTLLDKIVAVCCACTNICPSPLSD